MPMKSWVKFLCPQNISRDLQQKGVTEVGDLF